MVYAVALFAGLLHFVARRVVVGDDDVQYGAFQSLSPGEAHLYGAVVELAIALEQGVEVGHQLLGESEQLLIGANDSRYASMVLTASLYLPPLLVAELRLTSLVGDDLRAKTLRATVATVSK